MCDKCELTEFGCCPEDLLNAAKGPDFEGCPDGNSTAFEDCTTTVILIDLLLLSRKCYNSFTPYPRSWSRVPLVLFSPAGPPKMGGGTLALPEFSRFNKVMVFIEY